MAELLAEVEREEEAFRPLRSGETVEGTVAGVSGDEVLVDLAGHSAGVLSLREANASLNEPLEIGDTVHALVVQPEGPQGHAVLSLRRARPVRRWQEMAQMKERGEVIAAPVVEANRGGVVVDLGVRGFVPLSQLASLGALERPDSAEGVPGAVRALVGKDLTLKVIEVDQKRNRLILSEKAATQELRRQRKARAAAQLSVGDVLDGTVTHVTGFGLFVDVGIADGLVHRSEITWDKGVNPMTVHQVGDSVRVVVTAIDPEKERISLSIRRLADDPWTRVGKDFTEGGIYDAEITRLMAFGAFARIGDGLEGLVHVSELAAHRVAEPADAVQVGDHVRVKIVGVDPERRRLSLSIRQADGQNTQTPNV
ncbi:MAG TPA: S1 RNA-binding domain-containing protein [Candidatus Saccharimonadales bacterium]|nr:S1 RNA-binding domain-containing protein [Candidatus Saccharimonadales bacterium]